MECSSAKQSGADQNKAMQSNQIKSENVTSHHITYIALLHLYCFLCAIDLLISGEGRERENYEVADRNNLVLLLVVLSEF